MPIRAEQIKEYSLTNLQISLNAAIAQNKIANQINDPTGWISKGTLHIVESVPAWNGTQEGLLYYINSTDELFIGTGMEPYYALIANNGITAGFDSSIETLMGSEGNNWNGSVATRFSSENKFSIDGSNLFVYLNGMLFHLGASEDYIIIDETTIELNSAISGTDKVTFLIHKSVFLSNYATKAYVEVKFGSLTADIIPATSTIDIGSTTNPIDHIYANEVFLSASSLYVNGKKVVEDASNIMTFTTELDSSIDVKTTGIGNLSLRSDSQVNVVSKGGMEYSVPADIPSKNINFTNLSSNGQIIFSSTAPVVVSNDLSIGGNLIVSGTTTTVNSTTLLISDNIITLNKGQTGTPLSTLVSGIRTSAPETLYNGDIWIE